MPLTRLPALVAVALTATLAFAGCAPAASDTASGDGTPQAGGDLVHLVTDLETSESWQRGYRNNWYRSHVIGQLVENLVWADGDGQIYPWLAESWEVSEDGLQYDFTIRDGVSFSDGTPLTTQIVADNLRVIGLGDETKGIAKQALARAGYVDAVALDDRVVRLTVAFPSTTVLTALGGLSAFIVAPSHLDAPAEEQSKLENLVGTGPFVLDEYTADQVTLTQRADYDWPRENAGHTGAAYLDSITFRSVPEDSVRLGALEAGQADSIHYVQPSEEQRLEEAGFDLQFVQYFGAVHGLELRATAPYLDDLNVRKAIQVAIDRDEILETLYTDNWKAPTSVFGSTVPGWEDLSDEFAFDQTEANRLLDESGWTETDADGYRTKAGERLSVWVYPSPDFNTATAELQLVAQQLKAVGIELLLEQTDPTNYLTAITADDLPVYDSRHSFVDVADVKSWWHTTGQDRFRNGDTELDAILDEIATTTDGERKLELTGDLQEHILEQAYFVPLEETQQVYVLSPDVHGIDAGATGRSYFYDTWIG